MEPWREGRRLDPQPLASNPPDPRHRERREEGGGATPQGAGSGHDAIGSGHHTPGSNLHGGAMVGEGGGALPWWERGAGRGRRRIGRRGWRRRGRRRRGRRGRVVGEEKEREEAPTCLVKMRRLSG
jgi:hypothetical protein